MLLAIGTTNGAKIAALKEIILDYPLLSQGEVHSYDVDSGVADQPLSLKEMIQGAKTRAECAFLACSGCKYSFGIESGIFEAIGTGMGYLESSICAVYDGRRFAIGLSSGFEVPPVMLKLILEKKMDLGQAAQASGITHNSKLGRAEGLIGLLSKHRVTRTIYTKQCIVTALIQIENREWYHG